MSLSTQSRVTDLTSVSDLLDLLTFRDWQMGQTEVKTDQLQLFRKDAFYVVVGGLTGLGWICVEVETLRAVCFC